VLDGATATLLGIDGGAAGAPASVGRTLALAVAPSSPTYTLHYRVDQPPAGAFRCPVWLPVTPADGRSREVRISATLPADATAVGTMPAFSWQGRQGSAVLGHLPAFVRLPYEAPGVAPPWNIARTMDVLSLAVLVLASALWWRRHRPAAPARAAAATPR
jgi:hypothetical protein